MSSGGEITAVVTPEGVIATSCVINCAGAWSPQVAAMVKVDLPARHLHKGVLTDG